MIQIGHKTANLKSAKGKIVAYYMIAYGGYSKAIKRYQQDHVKSPETKIRSWF